MKTTFLLLTIVAAMLFSCKKEKNTDPAVTTNVAEAKSSSTCYVKATVSEKGSYDILDYGFVYSTSNPPVIGAFYSVKVSLGKVLADTFSTTFSIDNSSYSGATYNVRAYITNSKGTVYGQILNFQLPVMSIFSVIPVSGKVGDSITITGTNFSPTPVENIVKFNTTPAKVLKATTTKLIVAVPSGIQSGYYDSYINIYVGTGNQTINASSFTLSSTVTGFSPKNGTFGTNVTLTGENLYGVSVKCNDENVNTYSNSNTSLSFDIPYSIKAEKVKIKIIKTYSETLVEGDFSMDPPSITSVDPKRGNIGSQLYVTGVNFNPWGNGYLKIGDVKLTSIYNTSSTTIAGNVPEINAGTYDVEVNNGISSSILPKAYSVVIPKITGFSPASGSYGSQVTIFGENLPNYSYISMCSNIFSCDYANVTSQDSSKIIITIPYGGTIGKVKFHAGDLICANDFTIEPLISVITDFTPNSGTPGTEVTITGSGFVQGYTEVKFGTVSTTIISVSSTEIKVQVPSNAGSGAMKLSVVVAGNTVVSGDNFTIL